MSAKEEESKEDVGASIREFRVEDGDALFQLFLELQDFERQIEPRRMPGEELAAAYLNTIIDQWEQERGTIFIAEIDDRPVGFVFVLTEQYLDAELNVPTKIAYISDLVVRQGHRQKGIGGLLMKTCEQYAFAKGATAVMVNVLAANTSAREFYAQAGYSLYELTLLKPLNASE